MDTNRTSGVTKFCFASWVKQSGFEKCLAPCLAMAIKWSQWKMYAVVWSDFSTELESRAVDWQSAISDPENISRPVQIRFSHWRAPSFVFRVQCVSCWSCLSHVICMAEAETKVWRNAHKLEGAGCNKTGFVSGTNHSSLYIHTQT